MMKFTTLALATLAVAAEAKSTHSRNRRQLGFDSYDQIRDRLGVAVTRTRLRVSGTAAGVGTIRSGGSGSGSGTCTVPTGFTKCTDAGSMCNCPQGRTVLYGCGGTETVSAVSNSFGGKYCGPGVFGTSAIDDAECYCEDGPEAPENLEGCNENITKGWNKCTTEGGRCTCPAGSQIRFGCSDAYSITTSPSWGFRNCANNDKLDPNNLVPPSGSDLDYDCLCGCNTQLNNEVTNGCCRFEGDEGDVNIEAIATIDLSDYDDGNKRARCKNLCRGDANCLSYEWRKKTSECELFDQMSTGTFVDSATCNNAKCGTSECVDLDA